ncbi:MAG TPA: hypothetical protein VMH78_06310 [Thermoplasmata archaeon]|nr:hypothetical protein [Thermoplasmata archaeon]
MSAVLGEMDRALDAWDRHVDACAGCLVQGEHLCYEGEYLTESYVAVRSRILAAGRPNGRRSIGLSLRRLLLPGAA